MYGIGYHQSDTKSVIPTKRLKTLEQIIIPSLKKKLKEAEEEKQELKKANSH